MFADGGGLLFTLLALRLVSSSGGSGQGVSLLSCLLLSCHLMQPVCAGGIVKLVLVDVLEEGLSWVSILDQVLDYAFV